MAAESACFTAKGYFWGVGRRGGESAYPPWRSVAGGGRLVGAGVTTGSPLSRTLFGGIGVAFRAFGAGGAEPSPWMRSLGAPLTLVSLSSLVAVSPFNPTTARSCPCSACLLLRGQRRRRGCNLLFHLCGLSCCPFLGLDRSAGNAIACLAVVYRFLRRKRVVIFHGGLLAHRRNRGTRGGFRHRGCSCPLVSARSQGLLGSWREAEFCGASVRTRIFSR